MARRAPQGTRSGRAPPVPLTADALHARALRHLDRFDASVAQLRALLQRLVRRAELDDAATAMLEGEVETLVSRLVATGVVDDRRFAETLARGQRRRGASALAIAQKLRARGVAEAVIVAVLRDVDEEYEAPELAAARAFVRRRRLGCYRPPASREAMAKRDLGALARAGFGLEVARRALEVHVDEDVF